LANYYYSTQAFLAWCFNHYFYNATHWAFVGTPFYPYHGLYPPSSNPYKIYGNLYEEWYHRDRFGRYVQELRLGIQKGVTANRRFFTMDEEQHLKDVCDQIDVAFFYPVVYRTDVNQIAPERLNMHNSALLGSSEYRIDDLKEDEFDLLFFDITSDPDLAMLASGTLNANVVMSILESRC
jgi:hypothetical protein